MEMKEKGRGYKGKKRDVKPTINIELKETIYRLSHLIRIPVKDICESFIINGVRSDEIIQKLSKHFIRGIRLNNTLYNGDMNNKRITKRDVGSNERISIRLKQPVHNMVSIFAYALDVTPSRMCAILLNESINDFKFINNYINNHISKNLTQQQSRDLKLIIEAVTGKVDAKLSDAIIEESKVKKNTKQVVGDLIITHWRNK